MASISEIEAEIIEEFSIFSDWMEKYEYIIDFGKSVPTIDSKYKTDDYLIKGCQSQVWLYAEKIDTKVVFYADSDAIITKGIIGLLLRVLSNQTSADILQAKLNFIDAIELKEHLSPTRSNGLVSMINQIKNYAIALG